MKRILLSILLVASLSASDDTVFSDKASEQPNIAQLKEEYIANVQYATYATIASLLSYRLCYDVAFIPGEFSLLCANISGVIGVVNGVKWLFLHLFPNSTAADINAINTLDKLMYTVLALQLPRKYEWYREMCGRLRYYENRSF